MNDYKIKRTNVSSNPYVKPMVFGLLGGVASCFAVLFVAAFLMTLKDIPEWSIGIISVSASAVGSLVSGFISAYILRKRGLFLGAACGLIIFLLIFIIACICKAQPFTLGRLACLLANLILGALGGIIGINKAVKRKF